RLSLIFCIAVLFSGPIWAKSNWGVYWDWTDARLQSFFALFLGLCGYFLLRNLIPDVQKQAKISSVFTVFISLNALLTWGAIRWMDNPGNHPGSVLGKGGMDSEMKTAFYLNVLSYHILFLILSVILYRLVRTERQNKKLLYSEN
ncbi:MAG TPA: ABC transporter permease, partial [Leptospiraceae bacterium]|nr:ABC transporter permease [Leptospiraceae bacterium]